MGELGEWVVFDEVSLEVFGEVSKVDGAGGGVFFPSIGELFFGECLLVCVHGFGELVAVVGLEVGDFGNGNGDVLVESAVGGKIGGDGGEVSPDERLVEEGGVEEGEAEAFADGGGDDVRGLGKPVGEGVGLVGDDVEVDGEVLFFGEMDPVVVDVSGFFCGGAEGDGEAGIFGCVGCEETDFAEVFSADATDGIEEEVLVGVVS